MAQQKAANAVPTANTIVVTVTIAPAGYAATSAVVTAVPTGGGGAIMGVMDPNSTATSATFTIGPLAAGDYAVSVVCSDNVFADIVTVPGDGSPSISLVRIRLPLTTELRNALKAHAEGP
jgi:hypothetical protein